MTKSPEKRKLSCWTLTTNGTCRTSRSLSSGAGLSDESVRREVGNEDGESEKQLPI